MRKILLFALMLSGLMTGAQTSITNGNCKAYFKYAVNDMLMSPIASTAINFYDKSEGTVGTKIAWFWDFGDGNTSQEQNPLHMFLQPVPGSIVKLSPYRTVSLTILTSDSCKSFYSETINIMDGNTYVTPTCFARYKYYQTAYDSIVGIASFQLNNYSEGDSLSYFWQFDNGKTSTEKEPTITFDIKPSEYKVCLTVTGKNNCTDTFCDAIYITNPDKPIIYPADCQTAFGYMVNYKIQTFAPALVLDFYSKAEPIATEWNWNFDDGTTSNEQNPTHIFNFPLVKDSVSGDPNPFRKVCLTVKTVNECIASYCETINIYMDTTPPVDSVSKCQARFKYYQTAYDSIAGTASFQLNNYSEGDSLRYSWQFDNGTISTEKEPIVIFDLKQTERKVCLTVTGNNNCMDTFCETIIILNPGRQIIYPADCQTAFGFSVNYDIKTFAPALVLDFYSKALPDAIEWNWSFDDGTTSNEMNPTHIFNFPIVKDSITGDPNPFRKVCLSVKTATGCIATYCQTINIYMNTTPPVEPAQPCHAMFKYYRPMDVISVPEVIPYKLVDASEGKVISWLWQFEDGTTSTEVEPLVSFDFLKPTQKVCLTIYTADSCSSTWCETINVSQKPDTTYISKPANTYKMHYISSFPPQMSSCAGYAKAEVFLNDTVIKADNFVWSNGETGQEVKDLCPTQIYSVKATTIDGTVVSGTFLFNSDGSVTEAPYNWWVTGINDNPLLRDNLYNQNYTVEWKLCDGTMIRSDSIPRNSIDCGTEDATLILKDASGNIVYSENISLKTLTTGISPVQAKPSVKFYPNPVTDVLNIQYSGNMLNEMQIEIWDITGKSISNQKIYQVESGQNISLNVNSLRKGIYICKMISEKQVIGIEKFIK